MDILGNACPSSMYNNNLQDISYFATKHLVFQPVLMLLHQVASAFLLVSFLVNPHMQRLPKGLILPTVIGANILVCI